MGVEQSSIGGDGGVELLVVVQEARIGWFDCIPLPEGGNDDLGQPGQRAPPGLHLDVERVTHHEGHDGDAHSHGGDAQPPSPSHIVLDVHHRRQGRQHRHLHAEEVEVEEVPPPRVGPTPVLDAELVGPEGHNARPDAAGPDRREEEGDVEGHELPRGRACARCRAGAGRRAECWEDCRHGEADHAQLVDDGADGDGPEPAGEGVGDEGADEGGEAGGAAEVGEGVGGLHQGHVQLLRQVGDHVGVESGGGESVAGFICWRASRASPSAQD